MRAPPSYTTLITITHPPCTSSRHHIWYTTTSTSMASRSWSSCRHHHRLLQPLRVLNMVNACLGPLLWLPTVTLWAAAVVLWVKAVLSTPLPPPLTAASNPWASLDHRSQTSGHRETRPSPKQMLLWCLGSWQALCCETCYMADVLATRPVAFVAKQAHSSNYLHNGFVVSEEFVNMFDNTWVITRTIDYLLNWFVWLYLFQCNGPNTDSMLVNVLEVYIIQNFCTVKMSILHFIKYIFFIFLLFPYQNIFWNNVYKAIGNLGIAIFIVKYLLTSSRRLPSLAENL